MPRLNMPQRFLGLTCFVMIFVAVANLGPAGASVPTGTPVFTNPLVITNTYSPFKDGAMKVFTGVKAGKPDVVVDQYLTETRTFSFNGDDVETHILQETEFLGGQLVEISRNHFAQADNGAVYYFGETVDEFTGGVVTSHEGSWLVGGPTLPIDSTDTANAPAPTVFMPANPEKGDVFKQEDLFPVVDETDTVMRVGIRMRVPAARYTNVIQIRETSQIAGTPPETKWYAPNVGTIRSRTKGESTRLIASTLTQQ